MGAVGVIGIEGDRADLMYFGVLAIGISGAIVARFQPDGMERAMFVTAAATALVRRSRAAPTQDPDADRHADLHRPPATALRRTGLPVVLTGVVAGPHPVTVRCTARQEYECAAAAWRRSARCSHG